MVAAALATGILTHTRTQNQHRNRENTRSNELCYLMFALLYVISTHITVWIIMEEHGKIVVSALHICRAHTHTTISLPVHTINAKSSQ